MGERERHTKAKEKSKRFLFVLFPLKWQPTRTIQRLHEVSHLFWWSGGKSKSHSPTKRYCCAYSCSPNPNQILYFSILLTTLFSEVSIIYFLVFSVFNLCLGTNHYCCQISSYSIEDIEVVRWVISAIPITESVHQPGFASTLVLLGFNGGRAEHYGFLTLELRKTFWGGPKTIYELLKLFLMY